MEEEDSPRSPVGERIAGLGMRRDAIHDCILLCPWREWDTQFAQLAPTDPQSKPASHTTQRVNP